MGIKLPKRTEIRMNSVTITVKELVTVKELELIINWI